MCDRRLTMMSMDDIVRELGNIYTSYLETKSGKITNVNPIFSIYGLLLVFTIIYALMTILFSHLEINLERMIKVLILYSQDTACMLSATTMWFSLATVVLENAIY